MDWMMKLKNGYKNNLIRKHNDSNRCVAQRLKEVDKMTTKKKATNKWTVRKVEYEYGNEFKFDEYLDKQIKILAQSDKSKKENEKWKKN